MDFFKNLGLEQWWNIILYIGILLVAATLMFDISFLDKKHLFGLGMGLVIIGIAQNIALKHITIPGIGGYWQTKDIIHNRFTKLLLIFGVLISLCFFVLIIIKLF